MKGLPNFKRIRNRLNLNANDISKGKGLSSLNPINSPYSVVSKSAKRIRIKITKFKNMLKLSIHEFLTVSSNLYQPFYRHLS